MRERDLKDSWKDDADEVLHREYLLYRPKIIRTKLINSDNDILLGV